MKSRRAALRGSDEKTHGVDGGGGVGVGVWGLGVKASRSKRCTDAKTRVALCTLNRC